jgi:aminopeptidase C
MIMKKQILLILSVILLVQPSFSQKKKNSAPTSANAEYVFKPLVDLKATSVKDQARTSTCWCFATTSFIESELLRMGKGEFDLSEMFIVRYNYIDRLKDNYLRQGKGNLGEGSLSHDWMRVFSESGIIPEEAYNGLNYGSATHNHKELNRFINAVAAVPVQEKKESAKYHEIVNSILDAYFGKVPESFTYKGTSYTPKSFAGSLGINPDDYVQITSFTHFPFYTKGVLEVPDNWKMASFYNVPVDEIVEIMNYSLNNGYTVNWDGDVSEDEFTHSRGVAGMPGEKVTQEMRQAGYENFSTTDDHLMHVTGTVSDQNGATYYKTKNSWGPDSNSNGGYLNISENYVRAKTIYIMVHKDAVPQAIRTKLGI